MFTSGLKATDKPELSPEQMTEKETATATPRRTSFTYQSQLLEKSSALRDYARLSQKAAKQKDAELYT